MIYFSENTYDAPLCIFYATIPEKVMSILLFIEFMILVWIKFIIISSNGFLFVLVCRMAVDKTQDTGGNPCGMIRAYAPLFLPNFYFLIIF